MRLNVGCGQTPTPGWRNLDNSFALRLAPWPRLTALAARFGILEPPQVAFIAFARRGEVEWADARRLPCPDSSVDALYTSHMIGYLDQVEVLSFLAEAHRVLRPGGVFRISVPDLNRLVSAYSQTGDADAFVASTYLTVPKPRTFSQRVRLALVGPRQYHWLYDCRSLCGLLEKNVFSDAVRREPGTTGIPEPGALDLRERESQSLYVEAIKPNRA